MSLEIKDLVELGLSRLPSQWMDKPVVQGLAKSLFELMQPLEEALHELNSERGIYTAVGAQLDVIGLIVGVGRQGRGDEAYRAAILLQSSVNSSDSTVNGLTGILQSLTQDPASGIVEHFPATALGRANSGPNPLIPITLGQSAAAGVLVDASYDYRVGQDFMFPVDTGSQLLDPIIVLGNSANNNFLSHSEDLDLGYVYNPCSHGVKTTDPIVSFSVIQTDSGDTLITNAGDTMIATSTNSSSVGSPTPTPPVSASIPTLQADHYWPLEVDGNDAIGPHDLNLSTALVAYSSGFFTAGLNGFADSDTLSRFVLGSTTGCVIATIGNTLNYSFTYSVAPSDGSLGLEREMFLLAGANGSNWEFSIEASGLVFANLTKAFPVGIDANNLPNYPVVIIFKRTPTGFEVYDSLTDTLTAMTPVDPSYPDGFWFEDIESDGDYLCEITAYNFSAADFINNGIVLSTEITRLDMTLQDCQDRVAATLA